MMPGALSDLAKNTFLVVGALFPIVNPIGNTPIFLTLTRGLSGRGRTLLARMIALNGLALILTSIFVGTHILAFFGISLPVVQVGGGLVVISTGWALLRQPNDGPAERFEHRLVGSMLPPSPIEVDRNAVEVGELAAGETGADGAR